MKKMKLREAIQLLGLQTEEGFNKLMAELLTLVTLDEPRPALPGPATASRGTNNNTTAANAAQHLHIGPIPTTGQTAPVPPAVSDERCKLWPICTSKASECGGYKLDTCRLHRPSKEQLERAKRRAAWTPAQLERDCAYNPFCEHKAWFCGGYRKNTCTVFGLEGSRKSAAPSDEDLKKAKRDIKNNKQKARDRSKRNEKNN